MRKILLLGILLWGCIVFGQQQTVTHTISPATFEETTSITITVALVGGQELKFRANDAWTLNYGDDGANGVLEEGGANIAVAASGTYKITLDLSKSRAYTYTLEKL